MQPLWRRPSRASKGQPAAWASMSWAGERGASAGMARAEREGEAGKRCGALRKMLSPERAPESRELRARAQQRSVAEPLKESRIVFNRMHYGPATAGAVGDEETS